MEQINKVEIRGTVGMCNLHVVGDKTVARLSVATNYSFKSRDGYLVTETTWHSVTAWQGEGIAPLESIQKGNTVHITGRIRQSHFTDRDGIDRYVSEIVASSLEVIKG